MSTATVAKNNSLKAKDFITVGIFTAIIFVVEFVCGMNVDTSLEFYVITYLVVLALYFVINALLVRRINKFTPAEVLKNRE